MSRIELSHTTEYTYRSPVGLTRHRLMLKPDDSHDLRLTRAQLRIEPEPSAIYWKHDIFNNSICFVEWPENLRTNRLLIASALGINHHPLGLPQPEFSIDPEAETFPPVYADHERPDLAHLAAANDPNGLVHDWARGIVSDAGTSATLEVLAFMTRAIKQRFAYRIRNEEGTQPADETLALGGGSCRDFAVLMMEALRSFGLATRFVSGYLYDDSLTEPQGGGSTHAWCSVYVPGAGWIEYDPTNGLVAGANLIRVGVTREAAQAVPVSGGFIGDPADPLGLRVDVSVAPLDGV